MTPKTVSDKNTKQEILIAYQELAAKLEGAPASGETLQRLTKTNATLETSLTNAVQTLKDHLDTAIRATIEQLTDATKAIELLRLAQEAQRRTLGQEKEETQKEHARLVEEQNYEFAKTKKRQEEELKEQRLKVEAELTQRKEALKMQEEELIDLRNQVKTFEARMGKAVSDAIASTTKDLKLQFDHEQALASQKAQAMQHLLEQQVASLQDVVVTQKQEITRLNSAITDASAQVTRIAERAVTKIAPEVSSPSSKPTT